ncbi:hypothetical protein TNCV_5097751 [Trichonephila clavipes]|nr:hypothetical protein TNCV_5097751 [Trichonephila clavipes]
MRDSLMPRYETTRGQLAMILATSNSSPVTRMTLEFELNNHNYQHANRRSLSVDRYRAHINSSSWRVFDSTRARYHNHLVKASPKYNEVILDWRMEWKNISYGDLTF